MSHDVLKAVFTSAVLVILGTTITLAWVTRDAVQPIGYTVGQCLAYNGDYEPWEQAQMWYIEMVGKRNYLVRKTPANVNRNSEGTVIAFSTINHYVKVECPPKS